MKKLLCKIIILYSLSFLLFSPFTVHRLPFTSLYADDLYSFPDVGEVKPKKEEPKPVDPFIQVLSKRMGIPDNVLAEAAQKGIGRMEMIRLILMAKRSGKPLPDLIERREKGERLAKIAESIQADNRAIKKEAQDILKGYEDEAEKIQPEVKASTGTQGTAGVEPKKDERRKSRRTR